MMRNSLVLTGLGAVLAFGLVEFGCSSTSNNGGGTGGSTTGTGGKGTGGSSTVGTGGSTTGVGGSTSGVGGSTSGVGGSTTGAGGSGTGGSSGVIPACNPAPGDGTACTFGTSLSPCNKNCGANIGMISATRAQKTCTCGSTNLWSCPSAAGACVYPTGIDLTCFHIPTPLPACPTDLSDGGSGLLRPNASACTPPSGTCGGVCGSTTANSYQDSGGVGKIGYCTCIGARWQCASLNEWAPQ
jgi:hypothetical protein